MRIQRRVEKLLRSKGLQARLPSETLHEYATSVAPSPTWTGSPGRHGPRPTTPPHSRQRRYTRPGLASSRCGPSWVEPWSNPKLIPKLVPLEVGDEGLGYCLRLLRY